MRSALRSGFLAVSLVVAGSLGALWAPAVVRAADPPPAEKTAAAADGGNGGSLVKNVSSYVLIVFAVSLGLFAVCRPAGVSLATLAALAEKKAKH